MLWGGALEWTYIPTILMSPQCRERPSTGRDASACAIHQLEKDSGDAQGLDSQSRNLLLRLFSTLELSGDLTSGGARGQILDSIWTGGPEMIPLRSTEKRSWGVRVRKALQIPGSVMGMLLLCLPLFSQGSFGRILGTVTDQSGGVVSGATVTVLDKDRGTTRTLTTDDAGAYNAPNLTAGNYTVRAEAKGFKVAERQNIVVEVGREIRVDATLQPGDQNQTVTVTEAVPLVETTNATMGGTLENADIIDLPLNGRDYQNLLGLRPGVMLMVGGGPWTQSTNGVRPDESVWLIEGVFNSNPFDARPVVNMPSPFTDGATILPIDAIQEFNVMENPKAEYGWKAGAVVNVGIKSGTNQLHGSAYAFGRYQNWDARNYFNVAPLDGNCALGLPITCAKVPAQLKQFGGVAGGPIVKD